jgi:hypothetical protein
MGNLWSEAVWGLDSPAVAMNPSLVLQEKACCRRVSLRVRGVLGGGAPYLIVRVDDIWIVSTFLCALFQIPGCCKLYRHNVADPGLRVAAGGGVPRWALKFSLLLPKVFLKVFEVTRGREKQGSFSEV